MTAARSNEAGFAAQHDPAREASAVDVLRKGQHLGQLPPVLKLAPNWSSVVARLIRVSTVSRFTAEMASGLSPIPEPNGDEIV